MLLKILNIPPSIKPSSDKKKGAAYQPLRPHKWGPDEKTESWDLAWRTGATTGGWARSSDGPDTG